MNNPPQPQYTDDDLVLLSSYLDRQVTPAEQQAIEERLQVDRALQAELEELRITVALLRDLEPVVAPRSFTLDPAQVRPRRPLLAGWMRLGSLLAALILALTVTTVYWSGQPVASVFEAIPQSETMLAETEQGEPAPRLAPVQPALPSVAESVPPVDTTTADAAEMLTAPTAEAVVPDTGSAALTLPTESPDQYGLESRPEAARAAETEASAPAVEPEPPPGTGWVLVAAGMLGILSLGAITWFIVRPYRRRR